MVRPSGPEGSPVEKTACYPQKSQRRGHIVPSEGHTEVSQEAEGMGEPFILVCTTLGKDKAGIELAALRNVSGFWGAGTTPACLGPGLEVIRVGRAWPGMTAL